MRIALVCPYAWEAAGGVQVHVRNLATRLRDRGHDAVVLAPAAVPPAEPWVRAVGVPLRVPYRGTVAPIAPQSFLKTRDVLARLRPDVVHVHEPLTPSASMFATVRSPAPVVATVHAYLDRSRAMELAAPLLRWVWGKVATGVAVSEAAAAFLRRALPEAALEIVPNGVDVEAFATAEPRDDLPDGRRLLWVNRLDAQKGFPVALTAFSKVLADVPDAVLVVVGEGRDREALRLLTAAERERVEMRGTVPNADVPGYLAASEAYLSPAVGQESFGIVLVEAMAAGVPVVATDIPGYREVVTDGVQGLLVPPRARTYDWPVVVDRLEELYGRAIESAGYDRPR